jgi:hypothetical protein
MLWRTVGLASPSPSGPSQVVKLSSLLNVMHTLAKVVSENALDRHHVHGCDRPCAVFRCSSHTRSRFKSVLAVDASRC